MGNFSKFLPTGNDSLPKWQVALMVSVPVAIGLGFLYYKSTFASEKIGVARKKVEEKQKIHIPVVKTPGDQTDELKDLGNKAFKEGDYEAAIKYYTEAINNCPDTDATRKSTYFQNRAAAYEHLNNTAKVFEDCTAALNLNKRYTKALLRRSKAAERLGDLDLSLEDITTACMLEGFRNTANLTELDRIAKLTARRDVETCVATHVPRLPSCFFIKTYVSTYQHGSALDLIDMNDETSVHLLKKFKTAEDTLNASEDIETLCTELINECVEAGNEIIRLETILLRATYYILSKQNSKALADLEEVIQAEKVDPRVKVHALIKRGTLYQHMGEEAKREEDFKTAIEVDENNPDIYHHLGQTYLVLDNPSESVNNFRKAVALDPNLPISVVQHCYAEYKYAQSIQDGSNVHHFLQEFRNILNRFPDNLECITLFAQVLAERQEFVESEKLFDDAIKKEPKHAALLVHKALLILQWKAEVESSKELLLKALELDKDCEFAYETLATIEMQMGNYEKAVKFFDEAIKRFTSVEELNHLYCVRNTSVAQSKAEARIGRMNSLMFGSQY